MDFSISKEERTINSIMSIACGRIDLSYCVCTQCHHKCYLYGGAVRDILNDESPRDYDLKLMTRDCSLNFIEKIGQHFDITIREKSYVNCFSIQIHYHEDHRKCILLDITYHSTPDMKQKCDFDVNTLSSSVDTDIKNPSHIKLLNDRCKLSTVLKHIHQKEFIVLDADGVPTLDHQRVPIKAIAIINEYGKVVNLIDDLTYSDGNQCISRKTINGLILMNRIEKMKRRGWKCLNKPCHNPDCIMASTSLVEECQKLKKKYKMQFIEIMDKLKNLPEPAFASIKLKYPVGTIKFNLSY